MKNTERILKYIKQFGSISTFDAFMDLGETRLSGRIYDLKQAGINFKEEWIFTKNRYGKKIKYKKYSLLEQ